MPVGAVDRQSHGHAAGLREHAALRPAFAAIRRIARRLAGSLLFELDVAIEPLAGSTHARELVVQRSLEYLDRLSRSTTSDDASLQRELAAAYARVGQIQGNTYYPNLGLTAGAMASYCTSLAIRQRLAARAPADLVARADLAEAYRGMGDMMAVMDSIPQARQQYEQALRIREQIAATGLANADARSALAEVCVRLGDVAGVDGGGNLGGLPGALRHYQQALALRESLVREAAATPGGTARLVAAPELRDDAVERCRTLSNAGFLARSAGRPDTQVANGRRAVAELETMTVRHPLNAKYRQELVGAHNNLRFALVDLGFVREAIANSRRTVPMMAALADADLNDRTAHRNLGVVLNTLGRDLLQVGDAPEALAQFRRALELAERGVAADSGSVDARRDLAFTLRLVASATNAMRDHSGALATYQRAISVQRHGVMDAALSDGTRDDLAVVYGGMATALGALGRSSEALTAARTAVALAETASAHSPTHAGMQTRLARRLFELGTAERRVAHVSAACTAFVRSRSLWEVLRRENKLPFADAGGPDDAARALQGCPGVCRLRDEHPATAPWINVAVARRRGATRGMRSADHSPSSTRAVRSSSCSRSLSTSARRTPYSSGSGLRAHPRRGSEASSVQHRSLQHRTLAQPALRTPTVAQLPGQTSSGCDCREANAPRFMSVRRASRDRGRAVRAPSRRRSIEPGGAHARGRRP